MFCGDVVFTLLKNKGPYDTWTTARDKCHAAGHDDLAALTSTDQWEAIKFAYQTWNRVLNMNSEIYIENVDIHDSVYDITLKQGMI